jgi:hypothetical protein
MSACELTPNKRMEPTLDPVLPALPLRSVRLKRGSSLVLGGTLVRVVCPSAGTRVRGSFARLKIRGELAGFPNSVRR